MIAELKVGMEKYVGLVPWEGIGKPIVQECTAEQAIKLAGLDWDVETARIVTNDQKKTSVDDWRVTRRIQDNAILGVVRAGHKVIQNRDAFQLFDGVVGRKIAKYYNAGEIYGGSQIFVIAKLPGTLEIGKGTGLNVDEVDRYLVMRNAHDGKPLIMVFSPVRVVCENTLAMALSRKFAGDVKSRLAPHVKIRHNEKAEIKMKEAERIMGTAMRYYEKFGEFANYLYQKPLRSHQITNIVSLVFPPNKKMEVTPTISQHRGEVIRLFDEGKGHDRIGGTAWALINAFAEYADHDYAFRKKTEPGQRAASIWMGGAKGLKQRATRFVLDAVA